MCPHSCWWFERAHGWPIVMVSVSRRTYTGISISRRECCNLAHVSSRNFQEDRRQTDQKLKRTESEYRSVCPPRTEETFRNTWRPISRVSIEFPPPSKGPNLSDVHGSLGCTRNRVSLERREISFRRLPVDRKIDYTTRLTLYLSPCVWRNIHPSERNSRPYFVSWFGRGWRGGGHVEWTKRPGESSKNVKLASAPRRDGDAIRLCCC